MEIEAYCTLPPKLLFMQFLREWLIFFFSFSAWNFQIKTKERNCLLEKWNEQQDKPDPITRVNYQRLFVYLELVIGFLFLFFTANLKLCRILKTSQVYNLSVTFKCTQRKMNLLLLLLVEERGQFFADPSSN